MPVARARTTVGPQASTHANWFSERLRSAAMGRWSNGLLGKGALLLMTLLTLALTVGSADAAKRQSRIVVRSKQKIVVCHATGNGGFVSVNVAVDNIITGQGHGSHPNDIIPPFEYELSNGESGSYPGHNWPAGEEIWHNGCARPPPPTGQIDVHVACVDVNADGTYDAQFGYGSSAPGAVTIPVGSGGPPNNYFSPAPQGRGQVTTFTNGTVLNAFTVTDVTSASLTWTVSYGGHTSSATATASFDLPCEDTPSPEPDVPIGVFVTCVVNHPSTRTYDAVFGYESGNADAKTIPVGDANNFDPAPEDRGQPTVFSPGTSTNAVRVTGISDSVALTWTVAWTTTNKAIASADFQNKCAHPAQLPIPPNNLPIPPPNQPIGIFAECVTNHGSTYDATFGYVNENAAPVTVPVGARNSVSPGPADQGQPDTFVPGFVARAFTVPGISNSTTETWRVIVGGEVRVATATASFPTQCVTDPTVPVDGAGIDKSVTPHTVIVGQQVRFTLRAFNDGSLVLRYFDAKDNLTGHGLRVLSVTSTLGRCRTRRLARSSQVVCSTGTLAPGQAMTIHVVAQATSPGTWDDTATVPTTPTGPPPPGAPPGPTVPATAPDRTPKDNVDAAHVTVISPAPPAVTG